MSPHESRVEDLLRDFKCDRVSVTEFPGVFAFHDGDGIEIVVKDYFDLTTDEGVKRLANCCSHLGFGTEEGLRDFLTGMEEYGTGVLLDKSLPPHE